MIRSLLVAISVACMTACSSSSGTSASGGTGAGSGGASTGTSTSGAGGGTTGSGGNTAGAGGATTGAGGATGAGGSATTTGSGGGGGGTPSDCVGVDASFTAVLAKPLSGCSGLEPPCHNHGAGDFFFDPADPSAAWDAMVNVDATIAGAGKRVVPGDAKHSFLYRKLTDDLGPNEGDPMPKSGLATGWKELPQDELDTVRCWILEGAKKD